MSDYTFFDERYEDLLFEGCVTLIDRPSSEDYEGSDFWATDPDYMEMLSEVSAEEIQKFLKRKEEMLDAEDQRHFAFETQPPRHWKKNRFRARRC